MRYLLPLVLICSFTTFSFGQDEGGPTERTREVGLRLFGLDDFDFLYKKSLSANTYRRYRFFNGNLSFQDIDGSGFGSLSAGAAIGKETRSSLATSLRFARGPEYFFSAAVLVGGDNTQVRLQPGFGYVLGLQYNINERFYIGLETIPSISLSVSNLNDVTVVSLDAGFNSSSVAVTAMYRFYR
jgi:hypothetical protein